MNRQSIVFACLIVASAVSASWSEPFRQRLGQVQVGDVKNGGEVIVPDLTWGGDVVGMRANGGRKTTRDSIYGKMGLQLQFKSGDDFKQQVRDYMSGKSPFLRGTMHMIALASEVINENPKTQGIVCMQLTWSAGDHIVAKPKIRTLADFKNITIGLQSDGPHIGLLDEALKTSNLTWDDINPVWFDDLTGPKGPAEAFRKNPNLDAVCCISPDMIGLTGGLKNSGTGAEGTIKGAHVVLSTAELSRAIADVYVVRKDFYTSNTDFVNKFVAGYLKSAEELVDLKKKYDADKQGSPEYVAALKLAQQAFGSEVLPTIDPDAYGLMCDCNIVGLPGNVAFFDDPNNITSFSAIQRASLELALNRGYINRRLPFVAAPSSWDRVSSIGMLTKINIKRQEKFNAEAVQKEIEEFTSGQIDDRTIYSFTVHFGPNEIDFSLDKYAQDFSRVIDLSAKYGNAVVAVRGHADPTKTIKELVLAGLEKGILQRSGQPNNYKYSINGKPLDFSATADLNRLIESGAFDGVKDHNPKEVLQSALNLSRRRAEVVCDRISQLASKNKVVVDKSQIQPIGIGIREPFIARPKSAEEAMQNMRVEFRLMRVDAESIKSSDFDF